MEQLLQDIDELLAHLEDYEHGETGRRITELRGRIQQLHKPDVSGLCKHPKEPILKDGFYVCPDCGKYGEDC